MYNTAACEHPAKHPKSFLRGFLCLACHPGVHWFASDNVSGGLEWNRTQLLHTGQNGFVPWLCNWSACFKCSQSISYGCRVFCQNCSFSSQKTWLQDYMSSITSSPIVGHISPRFCQAFCNLFGASISLFSGSHLQFNGQMKYMI